MTGGKPIALLQSISGVSAINHLVAFYDIHRVKREVLSFYFVPDTTRDSNNTLTRNVVQSSEDQEAHVSLGHLTPELRYLFIGSFS
jgi:hypothetical protein